MNKRQRKKKEKKDVGATIYALWTSELKGDEPCDDLKCQSCYVQEGEKYFI